MKNEQGQYLVYGNRLKKSYSRTCDRWQKFFIRKFNYDPDEKYELSLVDNEYLGSVFGLKDVVRGNQGSEIKNRQRRDYQHNPDGLRPLPHCHGRRIRCPGDGVHAVLAGSSRHPWN